MAGGDKVLYKTDVSKLLPQREFVLENLQRSILKDVSM